MVRYHTESVRWTKGQSGVTTHLVRVHASRGGGIQKFQILSRTKIKFSLEQRRYGYGMVWYNTVTILWYVERIEIICIPGGNTSNKIYNIFKYCASEGNFHNKQILKQIWWKNISKSIKAEMSRNIERANQQSSSS